MHKKQNLDPNRSTRTLYNKAQKKSMSKHNSSLNTISSTQQYAIASKVNKNSQILAEIKNSKNLMGSKNLKQQQGIKTNLSTTRSNYRPKFILKDLMQEKDLESQQNETQSMCEEYFGQRDKKNHLSGTFNNNSPLASQAFYKFDGQQKKINSSGIQHIQPKNKSLILTKRSYLQDESKRINPCDDGIKYDLPHKTNKNITKPLKTQQALEEGQSIPAFYEEASTVQYSKPNQKFLQDPSTSLQFEPRIRSISTSQPCQSGLTKSPKNYKMPYLQTKKQLEIRSAYFNEAIQLCRHIIGNMKQTLQDEYDQSESYKVMWCQERCRDLLKVFEEWDKN